MNLREAFLPLLFLLAINSGTSEAKGSSRDEEDVDIVIIMDGPPCRSSPCQHGGSCINQGYTDFQCICPAGYHGKSCDKVWPCFHDNQCENGGTCSIVDAVNFTCACPEGHHGERCELGNPCRKDNPCQNEGFCTPTRGNHFRCVCRKGFQGDLCQNETPCRKSNPCTHGGTCVDLVDDLYYCECPEGRTGKLCETQVTCYDLEAFSKKQNFRITSSSYEMRKPNITGTVRDGRCIYGYYARDYTAKTRVRCHADGSWKMELECKPVICRVGYGIDVQNAFPVLAMRGYASFKFGDVITYQCESGYRMTGNNKMSCSYKLDKYRGDHYRHSRIDPMSRGMWKFEDGQAPFCVPLPDCGEPPLVAHGKVITYNTTQEYGQAEYQCEDDTTKVGDGIARCYKNGTYSIYDRNNRKDYKGDNFQWAFVPKCEENCPMANGTHGNRSHVTVKVTKCTTRSFARFPDEECSLPVFYHVTKGERNARMRFYGDELCVAEAFTSRKELIMNRGAPRVTTRKECVTFCLPHKNGYKRLVVNDHIKYNWDGIDLERTVLKYQAV